MNKQDKEFLNDRAKVLVDALEQIIKNGENVRSTYKVGKPAFYIKTAREALEQWKSGKGKEVENLCPNCGKELSKDSHGCCRECGAFEFNNPQQSK